MEKLLTLFAMDAYEKKARELCSLDHMNPDDVVDGAPLWKKYRSIAKALNYAYSFGAINYGKAHDGTG